MAAAGPREPRVSVVIRSYMRLEHLFGLVSACQRQDYANFEILIIEQSEPLRNQYKDVFRAIREDPRVRLLEYPKLGYITARNEGIRQANGEILLFIDDDDLPANGRWVASHAANFQDPLCVASVGREVATLGEDPAPHNTSKNIRRCLRYSPVLKLPRSHVVHTRRIEGVTSIKGGNCALRRSALDRVGDWDERYNDFSHEEQYFDFKFQKVKKRGEYYVYDPLAVTLRRLDIPGGMNRRTRGLDEMLLDELFYSHTLIRRFNPLRFYLLYFAYASSAIKRSVKTRRQYAPDESLPKLIAKALASYVPAAFKAWR
jgi:glycosyltransferase involved in cell wall biosynthesis